MTALLPEGRFVQEPDAAKLVKVVPGPSGHIVVIKLDDDSEIMVKTCPDEASAFEFADRCTEALNGDDDPISEEDQPSTDVRPAPKKDNLLGQDVVSSATASTSASNSEQSATLAIGSGQTKQRSAAMDSNPQESESDWSENEIKEPSNSERSATQEAESPEPEEPVDFPAFGSALEDSLEDSDEWPFDNGQDDWFD